MGDNGHYGYPYRGGGSSYRGRGSSYRGSGGRSYYGGYSRASHYSPGDDYHKSEASKRSDSRGSESSSDSSAQPNSSGSPYYRKSYRPPPSTSYHRGSYYGGSSYSYNYTKGISKSFSGKDTYVSSKSFQGSSKSLETKSQDAASHIQKDAKSHSDKTFTKGSSASSANLDSSRIWAKLFRMDRSSTSPEDSVFEGTSFKYKDKDFVEKFKNDLNELDEINKKLNAAYLAKIGAELQYDNINRIEKNHKLISQVTSETLDKIVNNEGEFSEYY